MNHTHTYIKYTITGTRNFLCTAGGGIQACPSGHAGCQINLTNCTTVALVTTDGSNFSNTGSAANDTGHTHDYYDLVVSSYYAGVMIRQDNTVNTCGTTKFEGSGIGIALGLAKSAGLVKKQTSAAIYSGSGVTHYHEYNWNNDDTAATSHIITTQLCVLGHTDCDPDELNPVLTYIPVYGDSFTLDSSDFIEGVAYCGFEYWKDVDHKSETWSNPPGGATRITVTADPPTVTTGEATSITISWCLLGGTVETPEFNYRANAGGLQAGTTYYWRAMVQIGDDVADRFYGATKSFTTPTIPPLVFGTGQGYDYKTSKQAAERLAKMSLGRAYVDAEGKLVYESRNARV